MDLLNETFSLAELSGATGINPQTIKTWLNSGYASEENIQGGGGPGNRRRFTFDMVMEIALADAINKATYGTRDMRGCFRAAQAFSIGDEAAGWGKAPEQITMERHGGLPHHPQQGQTFLFASGDNHSVELVGYAGADLSEILTGWGATALVAVNASAVFGVVAGRLEIDTEAVFNAAYPAYAG